MALKDKYDVVVIGADLAVWPPAIAAKKNGAKDVLMIERDMEPGGILLQCIHNGFGLEVFKQDLPGPAYAQRFINKSLPGVDTCWIPWYSISALSAGSLPQARAADCGYPGPSHRPLDGLP